jgi:integrase
MKEKLTDRGIEAKKPRDKAYAIGDSACIGLCIRITPNGVKSFAFAYRDKATGKVVWLTLGRWPDLPLAKARELADEARRTAAAGGTPMAPKAVAAAAEKKTKSYADLVEAYYEAKLKTLRTGDKVRGVLRRVGRVYGWNERAAASISDDDAAAMLKDVAEVRGRKAMANQTKHLAHAMFKWAKQPGQKFVTVNPFADLPAPGGANVKRKRFLSADEIRQVWRALDAPERFEVSRDAATALRLILVTAARPGMVAGITGAELRDLRGPSAHGPHWSLSGARMKNGAEFISPLSGLALELLRPHVKADPAARVLALDRDDLQEAARRIVAGLGMVRWTPHDLRRTAATILDRSGYVLEQIGAILAHTRKGTTAIYTQWHRFDLKQQMAVVIERSLRETLAGEPAPAVIGEPSTAILNAA